MVGQVHRSIERLLFPFVQHPRGAFRQIAEGKGPNRDTHKAEHFDVQMFEHPADVAVLAFI